MNQTKQVPAIIKILSIIALACAGLSALLSLVNFISFGMPSSYIVKWFFSTALFIAPIVVLFLYVLKLGGKEKPTILLVITLGLISFDSLVSLLDYATTQEILFDLPLMGLCAAAIVFTFVKNDAKLFGIITAGVGLLYAFVYFVSNISSYSFALSFQVFVTSAASALQYVVLLLLSLNGFLSNAKESAPVQPEAQPFYAPQPQAPVYAQPEVQPTYAPQPQAPVYAQPEVQPTYAPQPQAPAYAQPEVQPTYAPQPQAPVYAQPEAQPVAPVEPVAAQPVEVKPETPAE